MARTDDLVPFRDALNRLSAGWELDGERVSNGGVSVRLEARHGDEPGHYDIAVRLGAGSDAVDLWDCVAGVGDTDERRASVAAMVWGATTAPAIIELLAGTGQLADHYSGSDAQGVAGWHVIHAPIGGLGNEAGVARLQEWWVAHPLLPVLGPPIRDGLAPERPHGMKVLLGLDGVAEVRVDGDVHEPASRALASLDWPRGTGAFVRSYVLLVHPDPMPATTPATTSAPEPPRGWRSRFGMRPRG